VLNENLNGDTTTVGFLMKSLSRNESGEHFEWKFNLPALIKNYDKISGIVTGEKPFTGSTLFIKGEKSNYINSSNYAEITQLFPNHQLLEIPGAGHWVHADKPQEFVDAVMAFFN
jgi:pimeloyl-ACP methyl ester carboxylesterase